MNIKDKIYFPITALSENTYYAKTFDIIQASAFLGAHKETVRRLAATGTLPGVKIGRAWRFIEQDLINYMRAQYNTVMDLVVNNDRSSKKCPLPNEKPSGGLTSRTKEKEYARALGLM